MVRSLMVMLGVSLAVASFGCGDETKGTGGDGGTGGNGGNGGTVVDACINPDDLPIVCDTGFNLEAQICATEAIGDGKLTSECLQKETMVSKDCADCYGETTECTLEFCLTADCPTTPFSLECANCRAEFCGEFDTCRGDLPTQCPM